MSEAATESPTRASRPPSGGASGNIFQRKFGPLPGWGWAALAAVAAGGYLWYRNRQGASAAQAAASTDQSAATQAVGDDVQGQLSTIQTELQNLQGSESQEGETTPPNSGGGGGGKPAAKRHVSGGKESLNQIAKANGTSVAHIVAVSRAAPENRANLDKLLDWASKPGARRKGVVYYL